MPEFNRKIIVIAEVSDLSNQLFINDIKLKSQSLITQLVKFPSIDPAPAGVLIKVNAMQTLSDEQEAFLLQAHEKTREIRVARRELNDIAVSKWTGQIQTDAAGDIVLIKLVNYGVKYEDYSAPLVSVTNSNPVLSPVELSSMMHILHFFNSLSGAIGLPDDAQRMDVYETFDATNIHDLRKMSYLGSAKRGKFINHFDESEIDKIVFLRSGLRA